ncbi:hypothetical protein SAMN02910370_02345 [Lachnospiraceae bacterium XPB1003]|nr:hypothetical protein SAMN02910370_02345 [Lachnospiraceae bacterium XPB1003]
MLVNPDAKNSYFDSRSIKRLQDDPALRSQVSALLHNEKPVDENGVALEISEEARAMEEKLREQREHYSEYVAGIQNVNSAEQQGDAMEEYAKDMGKIMMVFRRMANGDIVPQSDEKKLMEYDDKMYQVAKNMQARELLEKKKHKEYDTLWGEKEEKVYDEVDVGGEIRDFIDAQEAAYGLDESDNEKTDPQDP